MKLFSRAAVAAGLALAGLSASAQFQVANSTGGQQVAGAPIAQAISSVNQIANNAQYTAYNAQNTANYGVEVAGAARNTANYAQAVASDAQAQANAARNRVEYTAWYNWSYTRAAAISACMATGANPVYCTIVNDSTWPAP
ncbi:hypothetical protein [Variovorax gossypii]|uniref:hypothetical protein n=1 Tax=uncultured Variovorax sp. TaxID=114708 RepID=UPI002618ED5A|nr:hypothetical protein [uncultured Variovorax sp.]